MKLTAYVPDGHEFDIRPAPLDRDWMDSTDQRYAYRCLPLNIANAHGWEIFCRSGFSATWNGGQHMNDIDIRYDVGLGRAALSHFGHGILTFDVTCLFRTEEGYDLMVQGPINRPKDGIAPLSGIVETDWAPYSFTMNWKFTRPQAEIRFEAGEPFCHIFPIRRGELEAVEPVLRKLSEDPELEQQNKTWRAGRKDFLADLKKPGSAAQAEKWQKSYYKGLNVKGEEGAEDHRTRLRVKPFKA
jgi:hypothetical protein